MYHQDDIKHSANRVYLCVTYIYLTTTTITNIYGTDRFVFITKMESVYCAVRAECYIYFRLFLVFKCLINYKFRSILYHQSLRFQSDLP